MQATTKKPHLFGGRVWCNLFGHHFETSRNITNHFKEYKCAVCQMELTNDEHGHKISLTPQHRIINDTLIHFYQKRHPLV